MARRDPNGPTPLGSLGWQGVPWTHLPETQLLELPIDSILIPAGLRAPNEQAIARIVESIALLDFQPACGFIAGRYPSDGASNLVELVCARQRLEALRRLGWRKVPCAVFDGTDAQVELLQIAENCCRADLTGEQRANAQVAWTRLTALQRADAQAAWVKLQQRERAGTQADGACENRTTVTGARAVAREFGTSPSTAAASLRIAGLSQAARDEAVKLHLDDRWGSLRKASDEIGAAAQVACVRKEHARIESYKAKRAAEKAYWQDPARQREREADERTVSIAEAKWEQERWEQANEAARLLDRLGDAADTVLDLIEPRLSA
jgi:ParB-like chromosome segregation protein Spo0J